MMNQKRNQDITNQPKKEERKEKIKKKKTTTTTTSTAATAKTKLMQADRQNTG